MGHNLNLVKLMNFPEEIACPRCGVISIYQTTDYDIDCGEPNYGNGKWCLGFYCSSCEYEWSELWEVTAEFSRLLDKTKRVSQREEKDREEGK